jgi:hypothetical protein
MRLARPLYESLPLLYAVIGASGVSIAYLDPERTRSIIAFGIGIIGAVAALTVFLHRQDYRALSREYSGETLELPSKLDA